MDKVLVLVKMLASDEAKASQAVPAAVQEELMGRVKRAG
jgi:hypothetical protein